jgi:hypothetical protein
MVSVVKLFSVIATLAASVAAAPPTKREAAPFQPPTEGYHRPRAAEADLELDLHDRAWTEENAHELSKRDVGLKTTCKPIYAAYYRTWRDETANSTNPAVKLSDIPTGTDIVFSFGDPGDDLYFTTLRDTYLPALHAKGTKVVRSIFIDTILEKATPADGNYDPIAKEIYNEYVAKWNLDGLDIDQEKPSLTTAQVTHAAGVIKALAKLIGKNGSQPNSHLIYDTNLNIHSLAQQVAGVVDYVLIQAYGRSPSTLQSTWSGYAPYITSCQFLIGFSFYEERGAYWSDAVAPFSTSRAYQYASWNPTGGKKGGVFSYAVDRDWKAQGDDTLTVPTYEWSKQLITVNKASST